MAKRRTRPGPGRPAGDTSEATRQLLIQAGLSVFAKLGYSGAPTREILERAGLTAPALYHHFKSKAGLYEAVAVHVNELLSAEFTRAAAAETGLVGKLSAIFERSAELQAEQPDLVAFIMSAPIDMRRHRELRAPGRTMDRLLDLLGEICVAETDSTEEAERATAVAQVLLHGLGRVAMTSDAETFRRTVVATQALLANGLVARAVR